MLIIISGHLANIIPVIFLSSLGSNCTILNGEILLVIVNVTVIHFTFTFAQSMNLP